MNHATLRLWASRANRAALPRCNSRNLGKLLKVAFLKYLMIKRVKKVVKEKLLNVPNTLTATRVILAFVLIAIYLFRLPITTLLYVFIIAALTDFLDGFFARLLKQETLFGARFDILADRVLWVIFGLLLIFGYPHEPYYNLLNFLLIFSREILCGLFLVVYIIILGKRNFIPYVRYTGKINTVVQGVVIPVMILSENFQIFRFYESLIILCAFFGVFNAFYYIFDLEFYEKVKNKKFREYYNFFNPIAPAAYHFKH